ncbi:MAG: ABC transporter permease [Rhodocyclaceae bacterium]|nr:ABC transporter permease [Rhodocyclaceae bacterium]
MKASDTLHFALRAATAYPLRTTLMMLAMAIGVAAVVVLTALGEGARRYVINEFSALGSNLVIVLPGRSQTGGFSPINAITNTPRDLTLEDAQALARLPMVKRTAPIAVGTSEAVWRGRLRDVTIVGTTPDYARMRRLEIAQGRFLPEEAPHAAVAVIGAKLQSELFGAEPAVGQILRLGDRRVRVVGVLAPFGQGLGMNVDEIVIIPAAVAQAMFNSNTLFRILIEASEREALGAAKTAAEALLKMRHDGEEDVTVITQDAVLTTFDRILSALTYGVAAIAAVSLAVAGILVMNVMLVAVTQRTAEIGLLKALGAESRTIRRAFLAEAALLSLVGAVAGFLLGEMGAWALRSFLPMLPAQAPIWAIVASLFTALATGLTFGMLPARRAAQLDPVTALMRH